MTAPDAPTDVTATGAGFTVPAPCAGRPVPLSEVPDPVFSSAMVGQGAAVVPPPGRATVVAPVAGRVVKLHPHAFVVLTADGVGVLVHLGINTSRLKGEGFEVHATEGAQVQAGDPMVTWDPGAIPTEGMSPVVPVVVMDTKDAAVELTAAASVAAGDALFTMTR